jgi:site-specific DNA recombinase
MRAALYIRVSTEDQAREGYSIEAQRSFLEKKALEWEYTIYDVYIDDGYSAKDTRRPALQRMLKDAEKRLYDVVIYWRLDRLTRSSKDFHKLIERLSQHKVSIRSATERVDTTTAMGVFQLELSVSLAQLERQTISERVHFVMEDRHIKGKRNGAVAPYGYDLVDGKLVINPIEAEIVRKIFHMYTNNTGFRGIAKMLNEGKVPKGDLNKWSDNSVYYILNNPTYCGKLRWNYRKLAGQRTGKEVIVDADHEPIITVEEFEAAQKVREFRKKVGRAATSSYSFTGVLKCGRCGYSMIGDSKATKNGRSRYYKCVGRFNYGLCNMPIIAERSVNEAFLDILDPDKNNLAQYYVAPEVAAASEDENLIESLRNELENIQKRKKKWQVAYANDVISLDDLRQHTEADRQREEFIKKQLEELPNKKRSHTDPSEVIRLLQQLHSIWYQIDDEVAKKNFINEAFEYITINTDVTEAKGGPGRRVPVYITGWDFNA